MLISVVTEVDGFSLENVFNVVAFHPEFVGVSTTITGTVNDELPAPTNTVSVVNEVVKWPVHGMVVLNDGAGV